MCKPYLPGFQSCFELYAMMGDAVRQLRSSLKFSMFLRGSQIEFSSSALLSSSSLGRLIRIRPPLPLPNSIFLLWNSGAITSLPFFYPLPLCDITLFPISSSLLSSAQFRARTPPRAMAVKASLQFHEGGLFGLKSTTY